MADGRGSCCGGRDGERCIVVKDCLEPDHTSPAGVVSLLRDGRYVTPAFRRESSTAGRGLGRPEVPVPMGGDGQANARIPIIGTASRGQMLVEAIG